MKKARRRALRTLSKVVDRILPFIFFILLIFGFDEPYVAVLTLIAAAIHELGHIVAIKVCAGGRFLLRSVLSGFRIKAESNISYRKKIAILLAGPFANLLFALFCFLQGDSALGYFSVFGVISLATALSNLLPAEGYDGYEALRAFFQYKEYEFGERLLAFLSFFLSVVMIFLSLYFILRVGEGYWIFAVFFLSLLSKISKSYKRGIY